jgi:ATP-binding cassette subfamily C protein CydD
VRSAARSELFSHLRSLGPVGIRSTRAGEAVSAVVESVEALDPYFARYLPQRAIAAVVPLAILVLVFPFDWISGLILTATAFFVPVSMILIGKGSEELSGEN